MTLGSVTFQGREIPQIFGDLGGKQEIVVFDFPGGQRSAQYMGSFPSDKAWDGELFDSMGNVQSRAAELNLLWQSGKAITLACGQWNYLGMVEEFEIKQQQYNFIKYRCKFKVFQDNSQSGSASNPATPDSTFGQSQNGLNSIANSPSSSLPPAVTQSVNNLNNSIGSNLQQSGGTITSFTPTQTQDIQQQIGNIQNQLSPIISGSDPTASAAASAMNSNLANMSNALSPATVVTDSINVTNPNLFQIASQYYGDAGMWRLIAKANGMADDPQPTGTFTNLVIPNASTATQASTWDS